MPKFAMMMVAVLVASVSVFGQDTSPSTATAPHPKHNQMRGDRAEQRLKRLSKKLSLSDEQKEKVRPILQDEEKQLTDLEGDSAMTPQQKHKKTREIRMASRSQIDGVLTAEQKEKMPPPRTHGGHHNRPAGGTNPPAADSSNSTPN